MTLPVNGKKLQCIIVKRNSNPRSESGLPLAEEKLDLGIEIFLYNYIYIFIRVPILYLSVCVSLRIDTYMFVYVFVVGIQDLCFEYLPLVPFMNMQLQNSICPCLAVIPSAGLGSGVSLVFLH